LLNDPSPFKEPKAGFERRRTTRLTESVPIKISGKDALGKNFQESTTTVTFDCYGCKYQSTHYLPKDSKVNVEIMQSEPRSPGKVVEAVVIWVERPKTYRDFYGVAVEFKVAGNVWGIESPPSDWFPVPGEDGATETGVGYAAALPVNSAAVPAVMSGNGAEAGVAVAEEMVVDCTVDMMTAWQPNADSQSSQSRVFAAQQAELAAREEIRTAIEGLAGQIEAMRQQCDAAIRAVGQRNEDRITAALEETRNEMRALRETVTASLERTPKGSSGKRKSKQTPQEAQ
jgi:hypothetical protein